MYKNDRKAVHMLEEILDKIQRGEDIRSCLSMLRQNIKAEGAKEEFSRLKNSILTITALLFNEDPKIRKNAALLLGDLEAVETSKEIYTAYCREDKLFVKASYLEALLKTGAYHYLSELKERYQNLCKYTPAIEEKKHLQSEIKALELIFQKEGKQVAHTFTGFDETLSILLTTNPSYQSITAEQLKAKKIGKSSLGVRALTDQLQEVVNIRTFRELLFPITLKETVAYGKDPEKLGALIAASEVYSLLKRCHKEEEPFYFRLEIRGGMSLEQRSKYTKKISAVIEEKSGRQLLNSTGEYEYELRILPDLHENTHVFLKMNTIPMERFDYRRETIAASMHPSLAALLMELARPYLKENAQILDPCCGVGTLLVERSKVMPVRQVYGTDIFSEAVIKARENAKLAGMQANFINRDYLTFEHEYVFDEIMVNMPPRGKKTKEEMDEFYRRFFIKSKELLASEGIIIIYSNENGFIKKQLRLMPEFKLYQEYEISKKNHYSLYIIG